MGELVTMRGDEAAMLPAEAARELTRMRGALEAMAAMLKSTTDAMEQLRLQVRLLEKATPMQAAAINRAIRERAAELCAIYLIRDDGATKAVASAIRRAVKLRYGVSAAKELPRCEVDVALEMIRRWDDFAIMKQIRSRTR